MPPKSSRTPAPIARAMRDIGDQVAAWRRLRNLTLAQVAERAGISVPTVRSIENATGSPSMENVLRVARALGVLDQVASAMDPYATDIGRLRSEEQLPQRVRHPRPPATTDD
jgi:transcriptional regulator with XRE-family HTH domain